MSIRLMNAVWAMDLPDSEKLVALALADWCDDDGKCWPSVAQIAKKCSKSERTVQTVLKSLEAKDALSRATMAGKGTIYHLTPAAPTQGKHHYVYRTVAVATGEFYIGARSCLCAPQDDAYMGSGKWVKNQISAGTHLRKEIIETYSSRDALAHGEQHHVEQHLRDALCRNAKRASAVNLTRPFTPAAAAPRSRCTPQGTTQTPAAAAPNTSRTIISSEAKASSDKNARGKFDFACPQGVEQIDWDGLLANRKAKRAQLTEAAHRQIVRKLDAWQRDGWPPGPIVALAAERGWTTVFETDEMKAGKNGSRRHDDRRSGGYRSGRNADGWSAILDDVASSGDGEYRNSDTDHARRGAGAQGMG